MKNSENRTMQEEINELKDTIITMEKKKVIYTGTIDKQEREIGNLR